VCFIRARHQGAQLSQRRLQEAFVAVIRALSQPRPWRHGLSHTNRLLGVASAATISQQQHNALSVSSLPSFQEIWIKIHSKNSFDGPSLIV
jgi:hypothetical protein